MKIPVGDFGFSTPKTLTGGASVPNFGSSGAALQDAGNTLAQVASDIQDTKTKEQNKANEDLRRQWEKENEADQALARAKIANHAVDRDLQTRTIADSIAQKVSDGSLPYTDAVSEYDKQVQSLELPDTTGLDPVTQENFNKTIKRTDFASRFAVEKTVQSAKVSDYKTQTDDLMDKLGKQAGLPGANVDQLNAQVDGLDTLGKQAYGKDWEKHKQDWRDKNWNDQVTQVVMQSRDNPKALSELEKQLTSGDLTDKLDSDRRNTQIARIVGFKAAIVQRQEAAAARTEREAEKRMRNAEAEFNTFQTLTDKGTILDQSYIDRAVQVTAGTPYQKGITAMVKQAQETGGIARQPINVQQATLDAIDKQIVANGRTPELDKRRTQVAKVLEGSLTDVKENGLRAGLERGVIANITPLDLSNPATFSASIAERLKQSETVAQWAGKNVSPLDSHEAEQLKGMLDALPPKQKSQAVSMIANAVGNKAASAIAQQIDKQDRALALSFSMASSSTTEGRFTSELILKGATAIKDGTVMKDDKKVTGWKATIANTIDGAFPNEQLTTATKEAAYLIAAGIAQENGGTVSTDDINRAVKLAVGGNIIERNGKKLPLPAGMDEAKFDARLKGITPEEIMKQTGSAGGGTAKGMLAPGNIDVGKRPTVKNQDGSISTVRSMSTNIDGAEVLIPTVSNEGKILTNKQAVEMYLKTGQHLGKFDTPENATAYAKDLHNNQETAYTVRAGGTEISVADFIKSIPGQELMYAGPGRYAVIVRGRPVTNSQGKPIIIGVQ